MKNNAYHQYISNLNKVYELSKQNRSDSSQETYIGERNINGQPHGKGKKNMREGSYYDGQWVNGEFIEGIGKKIYDDGSIYEGGIKNEKRYGQGTLTTSYGISAEGCWSEDEDSFGIVNGVKKNKGRIIFEGKMDIHETLTMESEGKYYFEDGEYVEGIFEEKGKGIYTFPNGDIYEGELNFMTIHGKGILKKVDGSIVEGIWKKGVIDEIIKGKNCSIRIYVDVDWNPCGDMPDGYGMYTGEIKNGKPNGEGTFIYEGGVGKYVGQWKNGKFDGKGFLELNFEDSYYKYDGEWKESNAHGEGKFETEDYGDGDGIHTEEGKYVDGNLFQGYMRHPGYFIGDVDSGKKKGRKWQRLSGYYEFIWIEGEWDREGELINAERGERRDGTIHALYVDSTGKLQYSH